MPSVVSQAPKLSALVERMGCYSDPAETAHAQTITRGFYGEKLL
jgi:hypothetical protein